METETVELPSRIVKQLKAATGKTTARAAILEVARSREYTLRKNGDKVFDDGKAAARYFRSKYGRK